MIVKILFYTSQFKLRVEGKQNELFLLGSVINCLMPNGNRRQWFVELYFNRTRCDGYNRNISHEYQHETVTVKGLIASEGATCKPKESLFNHKSATCAYLSI